MCSPKTMMIHGVLTVILSAIFAGVWTPIFNAIVHSQLVIDPDNAIFDSFKTPPIPVFYQIYFFNVNNPIEIQYSGMKPNLTEIGPFTYYEILEKRNFSEPKDEAGTIEYIQNKQYRFVKELSIHDESYNITTMNAIMALTAAKGYNNWRFSHIIWPEIERTTDLFETFTVAELLFDGWVMPEYNFDFSIIPGVNVNLSGSLYDILCDLDTEEDLCIPALKNNTFGFLKGANDTDDGIYRVNTGSEGMSDYLYIQEWKGEDKLDYWDDEYCDMINGTDGTAFPPGVKQDDIMRIFNTDLCRSLYLTYEKDVDLYDKVRTYRYIAPYSLLEDPLVNEDNYCFCNSVYAEDDRECLGSSMLNMAPCVPGEIPLVFSTPHFYDGDPGETDKFIGLNPVKEDHQTFLDVEPISGFVLSAAKRIQVNLPLRQYGNLPAFQSVPELTFPIFWGDENAMIGPDDADDLQVLYWPFTLTYCLCGVNFAIGWIFIAVGYSKSKKRKLEDEQKMMSLDDR